ncbi:MAG: riboflavin synthase [Ruminococcus sp.]|jgi:riboflavin synthase|nr:riboflavin synthase [Ruminococcus sp.]
MFTGIIEEKGTVKRIKNGNGTFLEIQADIVAENLNIGDSVAVNGVCLTVTNFIGKLFTADVMNETLSRSSLGQLKAGSHVNLERAMAADGRFGGHIVSGHIDGVGKISDIQNDGIAVRYKITAPAHILRYIVEKGSVAIDGISLTVAKVDSENFEVSVIPHTLTHTTLAEKQVGSIVNLENDIIGKYVEKLMRPSQKESKITSSFLAENGFMGASKNSSD